MDIFGFSSLPGYCVDPMAQRALSKDELYQLRLSTSAAMQNARPDWSGFANAWQNVQIAETRPLNERFEDFKIRLDIAITKHQAAAVAG